MEEKKSIVLLHGALGSDQDMQPLAQALEQKKWQTHTFSFSGHGRQQLAGNFGIEQFCSELLSFISSGHIQPAAIFGYSMGGYVALRSAAHGLPGSIAVFTLATKLEWTKEVAEQEKKFCDPDFLKEKFPAFEQMLGKKHIRLNDLLKLTARMLDGLAAEDPATWYSKINSPLFVGLGDRDRLVTENECKKLVKSVKGAGMFMLPHTPHPLEQVNVKLLATIIDEIYENQRHS